MRRCALGSTATERWEVPERQLEDGEKIIVCFEISLDQTSPTPLVLFREPSHRRVREDSGRPMALVVATRSFEFGRVN